MTISPPAPCRAAATPFECGLCGLEFTHGQQGCAGCALGAGCQLVKCPRCGYQFPRESRLLAWIGRIVRRRAARA